MFYKLVLAAKWRTEYRGDSVGRRLPREPELAKVAGIELLWRSAGVLIFKTMEKT